MPFVRVEPLDKDIELLISRELSPDARSEVLAAFAMDSLAKAQETNTLALGHVPTHDTFVDGQRDAPESGVKPDGTIIYEFNLLEGVFSWIGEQLVRRAPVASGRYRDSFRFYADNREVSSGGIIPAAEEYVFINLQPYSRKIERGLSDQAPEGVFQVLSVMAQARFGNMVRVTFSFRSPMNGAQSNISRVGPLQVKRGENGQFLKGSHTRAGNQAERAQRQPAIIIRPR